MGIAASICRFDFDYVKFYIHVVPELSRARNDEKGEGRRQDRARIVHRPTRTVMSYKIRSFYLPPLS
jgi:hypothetical protein